MEKRWIAYVKDDLSAGGGYGTVEEIVPVGAVYSEWEERADGFKVFWSFLNNPRPMPVIEGISKRREG